MKLLQTHLWVLAGFACLALLGCGYGNRYASEPAYMEPDPEYVVVHEAPPAVIMDRRPPQPSGEYVWIDGYWDWSGRRYAWQGGHWTRPPCVHAIWVAPRYDRHEQGYRYMAGRWREDQQSRRRDYEHLNRR